MNQSLMKQSIEQKIEWKRIRILGGEPTLHSRIFDIIDLLSDYQATHNPCIRLVLGTNYSEKSDPMTDQMTAFCRLCGHFGFCRPVKKEIISPTWQMAYENFQNSQSPS
ncbi:MAG: hypothetical protein PF482_02875 [Desulfobacteraceae bacterium]|jgi:hypothetical protein|nr:hypothetical protein [Desulfobacteraceae bacterium]